jgi:hypothetical protein
MKTAIILVVLAAGAGLLGPAPTQADERPPSGKLHFVCGPSHSEDMVLVPGTHWIIASGTAQLYLINADDKTWKEFYPGEAPHQSQDTASYPDCPGAPDPGSFPRWALAFAVAPRDSLAFLASARAVGTRSRCSRWMLGVPSRVSPRSDAP